MIPNYVIILPLLPVSQFSLGDGTFFKKEVGILYIYIYIYIYIYLYKVFERTDHNYNIVCHNVKCTVMIVEMFKLFFKSGS